MRNDGVFWEQTISPNWASVVFSSPTSKLEFPFKFIFKYRFSFISKRLINRDMNFLISQISYTNYKLSFLITFCCFYISINKVIVI